MRQHQQAVGTRFDGRGQRAQHVVGVLAIARGGLHLGLAEFVPQPLQHNPAATERVEHVGVRDAVIMHGYHPRRVPAEFLEGGANRHGGTGVLTETAGRDVSAADRAAGLVECARADHGRRIQTELVSDGG